MNPVASALNLVSVTLGLVLAGRMFIRAALPTMFVLDIQTVFSAPVAETSLDKAV